jgi:peptidyl-prolyl cis-trans isomerase SurA
MEVPLKSSWWNPVVLVLIAACSATGALAQQKPSGSAAKPATGTPPARPRPAAASSRATPPASTSGRLDGIAAVVNDDVVLDSDVEEQLYLFLMRAQANPDSATVDTLRRQVLDQLIDEKLVVAEAKRQGVTVPDADVNREVDAAVAQAKERMGSPEAFAQQLAKENLTEEKLRDKYREEIRRQMLGQRLVQRQIPHRTVSQTEAEAYFKAHPDKFPKAPAEVHVSVIQIPVDADSSEIEKARVKIAGIRARITGGEKFARVAQEVSDDNESAKAGGDLGYFVPGMLEPEFEKAAFSQKIGTVGEPVRSTFGWHIIEVLDRDTLKTKAGSDSIDAQGRVVIECHARHILVKVPVGDADVERARAQADQVRDAALKGADFANLARRYSKYQGPAGPDGDLGFISLGTLSPNIRAGLDSLQPGEVSDVLANPRGFNIFKLAERKPERDYTLDEVKDELPNAVANLQFRDKYDAWVKTLRAKARIQYR